MKITEIKAEKMSEESMVEAPVEGPGAPIRTREKPLPEQGGAEVAKTVTDHIAERQRKEEAARTRNSASSSVVSECSLTHQ